MGQKTSRSAKGAENPKRDHSPPLVGAIGGDVSANGGKKKWKNRWMWWKKDGKGSQGEREEQAVDAQTSLQHHEALAGVPDVIFTAEGPEPPVSTEPGVCSVSGWSVDSCQIPVLSRTDSLVNFYQIQSESDRIAQYPSDSESEVPDSLPVGPESDWVDEIQRALVLAQVPSKTGSEVPDSLPTVAPPQSDLDDPASDVQHTSVSLCEEKLESTDDVTVGEINSVLYEIGEMLGEGGFGAVYEGWRVSDGLKVAVKVVFKSGKERYISIPDHPKRIPREIALQILANKGPNVREIIQLLDWEDRSDRYFMVMEYLSPCMDLVEYLKRYDISVQLAKNIMWATAKAAHECCIRGVFHRDIKLQNVLINTNTLDVKLIDFGCGDLMKTSPYKSFMGTKDYCCPEYFQTGEYNAEPATVYSLGVMMFVLIFLRFPTSFDHDRINRSSFNEDGFSKECCQLVQNCLQENPERRIRLHEILVHEWFEITCPADSPQTPAPSEN